MATAAATNADERGTKRLKGQEHGSGNGPQEPPPSYRQGPPPPGPPPPSRYGPPQPLSYATAGGHPGTNGGSYNMPPPPSGGWDGRSRNAPYGSHSHGPPPHAASHSTWGSHGSPPPGYSSRGVPPPPSHGISDRYYSSTHHPHPTSRGHGMGPSSSNNSHGIHEHEESSRSSYPHNSWNPHGPPPSGSWSRHGPPPPQQPQAQPPPTNPYGTSNYGPPPPPQHLSHGPPSSSSSQLYGSQGGWNTRSGSAATPPRSVYREMDMSYMTNSSVAGSTGRSPMDDDGGESSAGGSNRDKGRGSYKCGRVRTSIQRLVSCLRTDPHIHARIHICSFVHRFVSMVVLGLTVTRSTFCIPVWRAQKRPFVSLSAQDEKAGIRTATQYA
jgi:hypothetical protein